MQHNITMLKETFTDTKASNVYNINIYIAHAVYYIGLYKQYLLAANCQTDCHVTFISFTNESFFLYNLSVHAELHKKFEIL